ncbi:MAG: hypothetical protein ABIU18_07885 [Novosphingobium sp.]
MAIDFIARAAAAAAASSSGAAAPTFLFTALGSNSLAAAVSSFVSSGYSIAGQGAATYVTDAFATAALAAAHPRCCKQSADGRYWRLVANANGKNHFRQVGVVTGAAVNNFPAIQALFDYAAAVGLIRLTFPNGRIETWQPPRTSPVNDVAADGSLAVKSSLIIDSDGWTVLDFKGPTGGDPNTDYQTISGYGPYRGGGLQLFGTQYDGIIAYGLVDNWAIQFFEMSNVRIKGNRTCGRGVAGDDQKDKGIYWNNAVRNVTLRDVEVDHFFYELLYGGNYIAPESVVRLERVKAHGAGQSCLNLTFAKNITDIDGEYGDSYLAAELFGANYGFTRTRFYDCDSVGFSSTKSTDVPSGAPYNHPANSPPLNITTLDSVVCDRIPAVYLGAHVYGDIHVIDGRLHTGAYAGDISLKATVTTDRSDGGTALILEGPAAVPSGINAGTFLRNIDIELTCNLSRFGESAGYKFNSIISLGGVMDPETCAVHVKRAGRYNKLADTYGTLTAMPFISVAKGQSLYPYSGLVPGKDFYIDAAYALQPNEVGINAYAGGAAVPITFAAVGAGGAYEGVAQGQRFKFFHAGDSFGGSGSFTFLHNGTGMALSADLTLNKAGSWIEFEWNRTLGKWTDVAKFVPL